MGLGAGAVGQEARQLRHHRAARVRPHHPDRRTARSAFHGHTAPLQAPDDRPRRSVAAVLLQQRRWPSRHTGSASVFHLDQTHRADRAKAMLRSGHAADALALARRITRALSGRTAAAVRRRRRRGRTAVRMQRCSGWFDSCAGVMAGVAFVCRRSASAGLQPAAEEASQPRLTPGAQRRGRQQAGPARRRLHASQVHGPMTSATTSSCHLEIQRYQPDRRPRRDRALAAHGRGRGQCARAARHLGYFTPTLTLELNETPGGQGAARGAITVDPGPPPASAPWTSTFSGAIAERPQRCGPARGDPHRPGRCAPASSSRSRPGTTPSRSACAA